MCIFYALRKVCIACMLKSIEIVNYKSIDSCRLEMSGVQSSSGTGESDVSPFLVLYGANASGKSIFVQAVRTLGEAIAHGVTDAYHPNKLHVAKKPTQFQVEFGNSEYDFLFSITYDDNGIYSECLKEGAQTIYAVSNRGKETDFSRVATDAYPAVDLETRYRTECYSIGSSSPDRTFLRMLAKNYSGLNKLVSTAYSLLCQKMHVYTDNQMPLMLGIKALEKAMSAQSQQDVLDYLVSELRKMDIRLEGLKIAKDEYSFEDFKNYIQCGDAFSSDELSISSKDNKVEISRIHSIRYNDHNEPVMFAIQEESQGTRVLIGLLGLVLANLRDGGTLIIDEMDESLHPLLLRSLVERMTLDDYNAHGAQLIFTAHDTSLLQSEFLCAENVRIVKKGKQGTTLAQISTDDSPEISLMDSYMEGYYSGIPYPYV